MKKKLKSNQLMFIIGIILLLVGLADQIKIGLSSSLGLTFGIIYITLSMIKLSKKEVKRC